MEDVPHRSSPPLPVVTTAAAVGLALALTGCSRSSGASGTPNASSTADLDPDRERGMRAVGRPPTR